MNAKGVDILKRFQKRWQMLLWLEVLVYAIGIAIFAGLILANFNVFWIVFGLGLVATAIWKAPWRIDMKSVCQLFNQHHQMEYSTNLILEPSHQLSGLAQIQQIKTSELLTEVESDIKPRHDLGRALITALLLVMVGGLSFYFQIHQYFSKHTDVVPETNTIVLKPIDSMAELGLIPTLKSQQVIINYPDYTNLPNRTFSSMDIKVLEGSFVIWKLNFEGPVESVTLEMNGESQQLSKNEKAFTGRKRIDQSGFYTFRFTDTLGQNYVSDIYAIEMLTDNSPVLRLNGIESYTTFEYFDKKTLSLEAKITDDYGLDKAFIVATVSRGKGESVKFREEQLNFNQSIASGQKTVNLTGQIILDSLKMKPGDELYFYVQAQDLKTPQPNVSRSETYFAVIKDTLDYGPGVDSGLGVDLMPDYFRSQRQLIIDTKKLISERGKISTQEFNQRSNELAFDQKALRLKYGKFMGDENEYQMQQVDGDLSESNPGQSNTLEDYTHDHDGDNEHNLVEHDHDHDHDHEHDHEESSNGNNDKDPLEAYVHNHSDPESSTLFADNLKQKLRRALNIMWDAELQLRLNQPEASLPYQYRILKLIQDIKNSARIYVHRIGFDPPPISEESRLTGELEDVTNNSRIENFDNSDPYFNLRFTVQRLEQLKSASGKLNKEDNLRFQNAGDELAKIAIDSPGRYIEALRQLKKIIDNQQISENNITELQKELLRVLPENEPKPFKAKGTNDKLNSLVLKELYE